MVFNWFQQEDHFSPSCPLFLYILIFLDRSRYLILSLDLSLSLSFLNALSSFTSEHFALSFINSKKQ